MPDGELEEKLPEEKEMEEQRTRVESLKKELAAKIKRKKAEEEIATLREAESALKKQLKKTKVKKAKVIVRRRKIGKFAKGLFKVGKETFKAGKTIYVESKRRRKVR